MAAILAISLGASVGAILRWRLGLWLNTTWSHVPLGTLAANLVGGYLIGLALAHFMQRPDLSPEWRLLVVTGFLGGLTTFSTFSAEVVESMMQGRVTAAMGIVFLHLAGSLCLTALGIVSYNALAGR
ncbi:fluoride efflux transporter CrcB [Caenimonas sp. SL110]|uniref:fluoride efflux transporter CrcB n=1 Tax=Caenimonas sp. SL110 TaxID=1450524 RepID=UPI000652AC84|nr:fluoride efflux transporter CrcB [Caenimonas sp. SL110]